MSKPKQYPFAGKKFVIRQGRRIVGEVVMPSPPKRKARTK